MINKKKIEKVLKQLKKLYPNKRIFVSENFTITLNNEVIIKKKMFGIQSRIIEFDSIFGLETDLCNTIYGYKRCCKPTRPELIKFLRGFYNEDNRLICVKLARQSGLEECDSLINAKKFVDRTI